MLRAAPKTAGEYVPLVGLRDVAVDYGALRVLQPTDLTIAEGEFLTILGPSGSGKTTILKLIGGFLSPSAGQVSFKAADITGLPPERRPFNTVFQDYALFPHMSVAENVAYSLRVKGASRSERLDEARKALELVGLAGFGDRKVAQLSGGQQQRVALARAIVAKPSLILLDEPLSALDAALRHQMQSFLKSIQRQLGTTFVFVTHDQQEALAMSDRIVVMNVGRIVQIGSPAEIYNDPFNAFVATFIGRNNLLPATPLPEHRDRFTTEIGVVQARSGEAAGVDADCQLAIRPECISVRRRGLELASEQKNRIEGVVREVAFAGTHYGYRVAAGARCTVTLECSGRHNETDGPLSVGEDVEMSFDPQDTRIIRT